MERQNLQSRKSRKKLLYKMKIKKVFWFYSVFVLSISSCSKESYPYTEYELEYIGYKSGLTSSSSENAFRNGLNEVVQAYLDNNANSSNEYRHDRITYEFTNFQDVAFGTPNFIFDLFWEEVDKYTYTIGSCFAFSYLQIPSRGEIGTAYLLLSIITRQYGVPEVLYIASKGDVSPKKSKTKGGETIHMNIAEKGGSIFSYGENMPISVELTRRAQKKK